MTRHIHHDLIVKWAADTTQVVEYREAPAGIWYKTITPYWGAEFEYRIRHKHQDLIDQKAARPELIVELRYPTGLWKVCHEPTLASGSEYRLVEPAPKTVEMWQWVCEDFSGVPFVTMSFYKTPEEVRGKIIQRADWTRISVEVKP